MKKEQEEQEKDQMELREKGLGGWDPNSTLGDDALGGWGGTHVGPGIRAADFSDEKNTPTITSREIPSRMNMNTPASGFRGVEMQTERHSIVSPSAMPQNPMPTLPRSWTSTSNGSLGRPNTANPFTDDNQTRYSPAPTPTQYQNQGFAAATTQRGYGGGEGGGGGYARF